MEDLIFQNAARVVDTLTNLVRETTVLNSLEYEGDFIPKKIDQTIAMGWKLLDDIKIGPDPPQCSPTRVITMFLYRSLSFLINLQYWLLQGRGDRQQDILYVARQYFF